MDKQIGKRKYLTRVALLLGVIVLIVGAVIMPYITTGARPQLEYTIVIDAGHGGRDGGSIGVDGSVEKDLNLEYAKSLQKLLTNAGIRVVMTRSGDSGLYNENADNKKLSDMRKRRDIINNSTPDLVISIHMNSFHLDSCNGAKTFYQIGSNASIDAAKKIQSC
jgi:N-acetylmuramoyl-L-alanine amidase